jgi:hypothetical protein
MKAGEHVGMSVTEGPSDAGPLLYFRGCDDTGMDLAAVVIRPEGAAAPGPLSAGQAELAPSKIASLAGIDAWRYDFRLGITDGGYALEGVAYEVMTDLRGDIRLAFVSCNGEEAGDLDRDPGERNAMWSRLVDQHRRSPFALLLQGGDQIYADEVTLGHDLTQHWPDRAPRDASPTELDTLRAHLREGFAARYVRILRAPDYAWLAARVPSLSVWDDHDICDGWGSLKPNRTDSAVGRTLFEVARETYLLFQHGATEADIPDLFLDGEGRSLGWRRELPGLTLIAPDLRSERTRHRIMGDAGWRDFRALKPAGEHTIMISSVPLLGPRLSLVETVMLAIPRMQYYEDDLRDQWQSHAHRTEWRDMLREVLRLRQAGPVTVLSGEIHLATRAHMGSGARRIDQLVASGIAHRPPPKGYARALGLLAGLGEAPLPGHPIRIGPLPGHRHRYIAERNFLTLRRKGGHWTAAWELEESGRTPDLALS